MRVTTTPEAGVAKVLLASVALAVLAAFANEIVGRIAVALFAIDPSFEPLAPGSAAASTLVAVFAAGALLAVLLQVARDPVAWFTGVAFAVLFLSWIPVVALWQNPGEIPGTKPAAVAVLAVTHLIAFAIAVPALRGIAKRRQLFGEV